MADKDWLTFDAAVAYVTMQTGLAGDVAAGLLSDALGAGQVRNQGRIRRDGARYPDGITSADIAFDANLQGEVLATDLRAWAKALGSGKTYCPDTRSDGPPKPSRVLTKTEREIARKTMAECRARDATNEEEEAEVAKAIGRPVRRTDIRGLRKEFGLKSSGRKSL